MTSSMQYRTLIDALGEAPADRLFILEWHDENDKDSATFGDFRLRARKYAAFLKHQGVQPGDRVVFLLPQSIALMAAFAGSMWLGALPVILANPNSKVDPTKYSSGLRGISVNLQAPYIVVDQKFPDSLVNSLSTTALTRIIRLPNSADLKEAIEPSNPTLHPQALAFIQHSAGTTGLQKGVALSHFAVLRQLAHLAESLEVSVDDRIYSWLPLYHDMGLIACFMLPMVCHLPVVMQSPTEWVRRPETMLKLIHDHRCTLAWLPNFTFQFAPRRTSLEVRSSLDLTCVRALINCSEPVRTESINEFYQAFAPHGLKRSALRTSYAMAENVFAVTQSCPEGPLQICADGSLFRSEHLVQEVFPDAHDAVSFTSSGRLLTGNQVCIISEAGEPLSSMQVGEVLVKSDSLFDGYYNRPDLTSQSLVNGWYRTGDLGFLCKDELFVVGRKKDLLIIGGENIYPQDVEDIVSMHPAIHDGRAVAFGLFNSDLGTEELIVVAEVDRHESLAEKRRIEREIRASVSLQLGVAIRLLFLKPPKWIVKSTAGKPARSTTRDKLLQEHPELRRRP
jgi:acyl-CoA synthetase (AMP-forming)/AMP-acid ligase II